MEFVAFWSILLVALVTHLHSEKVGPVSFAVFLAAVAAVTFTWGSRETLSLAMLGALLGLPVLIGVLVLRRRRKMNVSKSV